ncbi:MAG: exodeoxyribonuclease III, partial [Myxococcota bacterium]|nr:exodeoxyribonuclease III [Myxococcota bacterium]
MKIVTWNVNSLKARQQLVGEYLDSESPDVLAIQELKLEEAQVPRELFESRGYNLAIHAQKQWNGVLIASRSPITEVVQGFPGEDGQARLVSGVVGGIRLVNVYCPQGQAVDSEKFPYKLRFFEALAEWLEENCSPERPVILLGDINVAPAQRDVHDPAAMWGVPTFHPRELEAWGRFTWWGLQDAVVDHV